MSQNNSDPSKVSVEETRIVLNKYDGDFTSEDIETGLAGQPVETLVIENDEIVEHIIHSAEGGT